jgi:hypothetical protein
VTLFRRMGRQLPDLPPLKPLQRDPEPVITTSITVDDGGAVARLAALTEALDAAAARMQAAMAEMPPRPGRQPPDDEMPWAGAFSSGGINPAYDPCGAPPLKSGGTT